jgi:hypothetical protein
MEGDGEAECTLNLSLEDGSELLGVVQQVVDSGGGEAAALFPRFRRAVRPAAFPGAAHSPAACRPLATNLYAMPFWCRSPGTRSSRSF